METGRIVSTWAAPLARSWDVASPDDFKEALKAVVDCAAVGGAGGGETGTAEAEEDENEVEVVELPRERARARTTKLPGERGEGRIMESCQCVDP